MAGKLGFQLAFCCAFLCFTVASSQQDQNYRSEYEYVIVGSGPGGGPLAANLARAGHSVLLLEAGSDDGSALIQRMPAFADTVSEDPSMSWEFFVDHYSDQEQARRDSKFTWRNDNGSFHVGPNPPPGAEPLGIFYPRAGTLGGCGNHNAMGLVLPPDSDWEHIAGLTNDSSWKPKSMRRYFKRLENCQYLAKGSVGHGFKGYLQSNLNNISFVAGQPGLVSVLKSAAESFGDAVNRTTEEIFGFMQRDVNSLDPLQHPGIYSEPVHVSKNRERSSAQTYLADTVNALNHDGSKKYPLTIKTESLATRILFDTRRSHKGKPKAIGIEYLNGQSVYKADPRYNGTQIGISRKVFVSREVIIAGGVFNTPQILKLSGIGPKAELESFNIPVLVDLPAVGANLQDNYETAVVETAAQDFVNPFQNCTFLQPGDPCQTQWENEHTGPYGMAAAPANMMVRSSVAEDKDVDLYMFGAAGTVFRGHFPGFSRQSAPANAFFWSIIKVHPKNRAGTIKLRSANPQDTPLINFNFFAEGSDHDLQAISEGVQFARSVFANTSAPFGPFEAVLPDPSKDLKQAIRDETFSHHATSSCVMGPAGDRNSCVDSKFRVTGTESLRVVDGSVFPRTPGAFPVLATFMLSEKATDDILAACN